MTKLTLRTTKLNFKDQFSYLEAPSDYSCSLEFDLYNSLCNARKRHRNDFVCHSLSFRLRGGGGGRKGKGEGEKKRRA